jgi:hypothetical protein
LKLSCLELPQFIRANQQLRWIFPWLWRQSKV